MHRRCTIRLLVGYRGGFVCRSGDATAIATALQALVRDESMRHVMGQRSKERVNEWNFDRAAVGVLAAIAAMSRVEGVRGLRS